MNTSKTELMYFGTETILKKSVKNPVQVVDDNVISSDCIHYPGAWLDENLNFKTQMLKKCSTAMWNIYRIRHIRDYIDLDTCNILCCSLVLSHLDYSNYILSGATNTCIKQLQRVQNITAKLVLKQRKNSSSFEALKILHRLLVRCRIDF